MTGLCEGCGSEFAQPRTGRRRRWCTTCVPVGTGGLAAWRALNHDAVARHNSNRRSRLASRDGRRLRDISSAERAYLEHVARDPCSYCAAPATELDHIDPREKGSETWESFAPACRSCNASKGRHPLLRWMLRRRILSEIEGLRAEARACDAS